MKEPILCSLCFKNVGLRGEAAKMGACANQRCTHCGREGGARIDRIAATELFRNFYCRGSQAASYLPQVFVEGVTTDEDIQFEASAQIDYKLLSTLLGLTVRRNTPSSYVLGFTEIRSAIDEALSQDPASASEETVEGLRDGLRRLLAAGSEHEFRGTETIYRARISPARPLEPTEFDSPPTEKASANRIASAGDRVLCASLNIETCLIEIRPHIDDLIHNKVFLASLRPTRTLKLMNFTVEAKKVRLPSAPPWSSADLTLEAFFEPNQNSYHLTQLLSCAVRNRGYDGIVYPSAMERVASSVGVWKNVALFGAPISEGKLTVESINRVLVRSVAHNFELGPAWEDDAKGNHLAPFLKGWTNRDNA